MEWLPWMHALYFSVAFIPRMSRYINSFINIFGYRVNRTNNSPYSPLSLINFSYRIQDVYFSNIFQTQTSSGYYPNDSLRSNHKANQVLAALDLTLPPVCQRSIGFLTMQY
ncbi:hypothetical protein SAMN05192529_1443 [Arachidicoccus rhizosphaerae]|uniref:Uncharacterized protein n=1 Tax=Arachidicoccus rhizosphaerae TaxID=551991 RepID=A0A1H4D4H4_9BACT|nr:hypothetical protein SAMN05192529_1443 [Arachidicoccus rhizosphaerae]